MYRKHFGLTRHPFGKDLAPEDLFGSAANRELEVRLGHLDRKSTRLNSSHLVISYAVFCLKKKKPQELALLHLRRRALRRQLRGLSRHPLSLGRSLRALPPLVHLPRSPAARAEARRLAASS